MSFLRTLLQPDYEEDPERALVGNASNILQVGEFQFLQLAYFEFYDQEMPEHITNRVFRNYMVNSAVPKWARQFAQKVVDADAAGEIDINHDFFHRYDQDFGTPPTSGVKKFVIATSLIVGLLGGGLVVSHYAVRDGGASILPPYFDDRNLEIKKPQNKNNSSVLPWQRD
jgi:hypothetical protein